MAKPTAQACHAMTTYFTKKYKEVVGTSPSVNRNTARYGFEGLLMDYSPANARELVDYYIEHYSEPVLQWFLYNYEKVDAEKQEKEEKKLSEAKRRKETQARLQEWRERWKK